MTYKLVLVHMHRVMDCEHDIKRKDDSDQESNARVLDHPHARAMLPLVYRTGTRQQQLGAAHMAFVGGLGVQQGRFGVADACCWRTCWRG